MENGGLTIMAGKDVLPGPFQDMEERDSALREVLVRVAEALVTVGVIRYTRPDEEGETHQTFTGCGGSRFFARPLTTVTLHFWEGRFVPVLLEGPEPPDRCPNCKRSVPEWSKLFQRYGDNNLDGPAFGKIPIARCRCGRETPVNELIFGGGRPHASTRLKVVFDGVFTDFDPNGLLSAIRKALAWGGADLALEVY